MSGTIAFTLLTTLAVACAAWLTVKKLWARADRPPPPVADGVAIPVRGLELGHNTRNSLSPRLAITAEGLRFKVIFEQFWRFADIRRVDVARTLMGSDVLVTASKTLRITVADRAAAQRFLAALPRSLPLTAKAVALRDGE